MGLEFKVLSERKGSNPGGRCSLGPEDEQYIFYIKYCNNSRISNRENSNFVFYHQPIYEAVTFEMARKIGLNSPDFHVLINKDRKTRFIPTEGVKSDIREGKLYYFLSSLMHISTENEEKELSKQTIDREAIYRDALQISDIVGRKQNYHFTRGKLFYLDLGCSFVDAKEGHITFRMSHPRPLDRKEFKQFMKRLERYYLICNDSGNDNGNDTIIGLDEFVQLPNDLSIPVMDYCDGKRYMPLRDLISQSEIQEIVNRLAAGLLKRKFLKKNEDSEYLLRNR